MHLKVQFMTIYRQFMKPTVSINAARQFIVTLCLLCSKPFLHPVKARDRKNCLECTNWTRRACRKKPSTSSIHLRAVWGHLVHWRFWHRCCVPNQRFGQHRSMRYADAVLSKSLISYTAPMQGFPAKRAPSYGAKLSRWNLLLGEICSRWTIFTFNRGVLRVRLSL